MSDVTNNEEVVEVADTVAATPEVVAVVEAEAVVAEAPVEATPAEAVVDDVVEATVAADEAEATAVATEEPAVKEVVAEAPAPAPAPKAKVPATFIIKTPAKTEKLEVAEVADDGTRSNGRKIREGIVISNKMDQTLVVAVNERVSHPKYGKTVQRTKKLYVHDEANDAKIGDRVRVAETRPLSKLKRWRLTEVVERAR